VVVVGHDWKLTYAKCCIAALAIRAGAQFIGTNPDSTLPTEHGLLPETGSLLALLQTATSVEPVVVGKPAPAMFEAGLHLLGADASRTLVIGDRLDTDMAGAQRAGLSAVLVLTGATSAGDLRQSTALPHGVYPDLPELLAGWRESRASQNGGR
jgi:4-nitrophenyl phosphatase